MAIDLNDFKVKFYDYEGKLYAIQICAGITTSVIHNGKSFRQYSAELNVPNQFNGENLLLALYAFEVTQNQS